MLVKNKLVPGAPKWLDAKTTPWAFFRLMVMKSSVAYEMLMRQVDGGIEFIMKYASDSPEDHFLAEDDNAILWLTVLYVANFQSIAGFEVDSTLGHEAAKRLALDWQRPERLRATSIQQLRRALFATFGLEDDLIQGWEKIVNAIAQINELRPTRDQILAQIGN